MKILVLARYSHQGASSRLRLYQYIPYLQSRGWSITVSPLLGNEYIQELYNKGSRDISYVLISYWNRLRILIQSRSYDLVWIEKEIFPMLPAWAEVLLYKSSIPYVVDFDDAIFHNYDLHPNKLVRKVLGNKIDQVMKFASLVITGNEYLATHAKRAGAKWVEVIPTVVDISRYEPIYSRNSPFTIGWIGSPSTTKYLNLIKPVLLQFSTDYQFRTVLVGSGSFEIDQLPIEIKSWSEDTETQDIQNFDVGIMPLIDDPWERGKCGYKLIQYMACGKPVIASPVGVNNEIVKNGINGFLVENEAEWITAFKKLYDNQDVAVSMGMKNREKVEKQYCIQVTESKIDLLLRTIVD